MEEDCCREDPDSVTSTALTSAYLKQRKVECVLEDDDRDSFEIGVECDVHLKDREMRNEWTRPCLSE